VITGVDTRVLIDVFRDDPNYGRLSAEALRRCIRDGRLVACDVVWAELAGVFPSPDLLEATMEHLGIGFLPMERPAALLAGALWREYRARAAMRDRVIADFLIAAHARVQCDRLLTRDRGFCRDYFKDLTVIDPSV
jgi:hypothetical protein